MSTNRLPPSSAASSPVPPLPVGAEALQGILAQATRAIELAPNRRDCALYAAAWALGVAQRANVNLRDLPAWETLGTALRFLKGF